MKQLCLFIYLFEREHTWGRSRERKRERWSSRGGRIPSRLHTVSTEPDAELEPMNCGIMT